MPRSVYGEAYRKIRLCVDSYEKGVPVGRFYHPGQQQDGDGYESLTELLVKVEALLDGGNFPQSFSMLRTFSPLCEPPAAVVTEAPKTGRLATFILRIAFRQNASWQGSLTWLEGRGEQSFRSVLELILLMDSALRSVGEAQGGE